MPDMRLALAANLRIKNRVTNLPAQDALFWTSPSHVTLIILAHTQGQAHLSTIGRMVGWKAQNICVSHDSYASPPLTPQPTLGCLCTLRDSHSLLNPGCVPAVSLFNIIKPLVNRISLLRPGACPRSIFSVSISFLALAFLLAHMRSFVPCFACTHSSVRVSPRTRHQDW